MFLKFALLLMLPLVALSAKVQPKDEDWVKPWFCKNDIDCPIFSVISTNSEYELRSYKSGRWVSTQIVGMDLGEAGSIGFNRLFDYISGANAQGVKIDMTAPVITKVLPGDGPNCESTFIVSFYVPYRNQENTPAPTNPDIFIETFAEMNVYVRSFSGFATTEDYLRNAVQLSEAIGDTSQHETEYYYTAGYDSPFTLFNRHNEVWFVAKA